MPLRAKSVATYRSDEDKIFRIYVSNRTMPLPSGSVGIVVVARPPRSLQAKSVVPATAGDLIRSRRQKSDARAAADLTAPRVGSELVCWTDRRRLRRCRRGGGRRRSTPGASWIDSMPPRASRGRRSQRLRPRGPRFFPDGAAAAMRPERSPRARWSESCQPSALGLLLSGWSVPDLQGGEVALASILDASGHLEGEVSA